MTNYKKVDEYLSKDSDVELELWTELMDYIAENFPRKDFIDWAIKTHPEIIDKADSLIKQDH